MHRLIEQFLRDPSETRGRQQSLSVSRERDRIRYVAPNGIEFTIDCSDAGSCGEPHVSSPAAVRYGTSHEAHTLGNGRVCLASSLRGWDLAKILVYCDSWAKGVRIYERTGTFPPSPKDVFTCRA